MTSSQRHTAPVPPLAAATAAVAVWPFGAPSSARLLVVGSSGRPAAAAVAAGAWRAAATAARALSIAHSCSSSKKKRIESVRISRDSTNVAPSQRIIDATTSADGGEHPASSASAYISGTRTAPKAAGSARSEKRSSDGGYASPILRNGNEPSYPDHHAGIDISSLPSGGWMSKKYSDLT